MADHREGLQADKPIPPWEKPGCFRMDCERHRGALLSCLALASLLLSLFLYGLVLGVPLGFCTWQMAKRDLAKMQVGLMDRNGEEKTAFAEEWSFIGMGVGLGIVLISTVVGVLARFFDGRY